MPTQGSTPPLRSRLRWPLAAAQLTAAAVHVPVTPAHLREAPYAGALFIAMTVTCLVLTVRLLAHDSAACYAGCASLCTGAVAAYALTRTVAVPQLSDDVGNWLEPLGVAAVLSEIAVVLLAVQAVRRRQVPLAS